jgi:hypothetical protein
MGVKATEVSLTIQLHLHAEDLMEQLSFLGLNLLFVLALAAPCEQLTGNIKSCRLN